ncbi:hypothetical protein GLW05_20700 [Pontibacillus yanchengensis]|uniref:Uncharacterized protein n=1 Tax=Pontibacillus yanchengensis TaxID=462910 RepID=A0A6I5A6P7_9BACI|nr:hypothetical protein [Pontibacillus yanchengensis]MYL35993.1 hypothetical protein [Pontibacillus yanchengensis]
MKLQFHNFSIDQLSESSAVFSADNFQANFSASSNLAYQLKIPKKRNQKKAKFHSS